ncbi:hypothetical protein [Xanthomonas sp. SS]|uniref:hypothetical protein n=1 Tax=Xanthomonas sp. SS TaxID=2724122 RepID=UPI00163A415D|nr:hypothetical protein [Xanthomonas sp. SS]
MILALGLVCTLMGTIFFIGCFIRVDSPAFISRAAGNQAKIAKLRSLQDAWDRLGKVRQFFASCIGYLIMAAGLLLLWHDPRLARYFWVVPALYAMNLSLLLQIKGYARSVLDQKSIGHTEVLRVISQHITMCIMFSIIFSLLALRP